MEGMVASIGARLGALYADADGYLFFAGTPPEKDFAVLNHVRLALGINKALEKLRQPKPTFVYGFNTITLNQLSWEYDIAVDGSTPWFRGITQEATPYLNVDGVEELVAIISRTPNTH